MEILCPSTLLWSVPVCILGRWGFDRNRRLLSCIGVFRDLGQSSQRPPLACIEFHWAGTSSFAEIPKPQVLEVAWFGHCLLAGDFANIPQLDNFELDHVFENGGHQVVGMGGQGHAFFFQVIQQQIVANKAHA